MPSFYPNCDLRDLLRAKEDKVSRLPQVMKWCEDLYQSEPHRHHEVVAKKSVVSNIMNQTLAEPRYAMPTKSQEEAVPKPSSSKVTLSKETDTRPTTQPPVLNESEDKCESNDALKLMLSLQPSALSGQLFAIYF